MTGSELVAVPIFRSYTIFATGCWRTKISVKRDARLIRQESGTAIRFLSSKCPIDVIAKIGGYPLLGA